MRKIGPILLLGGLVTLVPLTATALCLPSQGCNLQQQQSNSEALQRQLDSQRATMQQNQLEQQRARTQILQTPQSQSTPLQRLEQQKRLKDADDNLRQSQQDYWQSQNKLLDSRRAQDR